METIRKVRRNLLGFKLPPRFYLDPFKLSLNFNKTRKLLGKIKEFKKRSSIILILALTMNNDLTNTKLTESKTTDLLKNFTDALENKDQDFFDDKTEINDAVLEGFNVMQELYNVKEPLLYKMGFYLDPTEPAAKLATFKAPNIKATLQSKYGFATVQATLRLAQRNPLQLSRQNEDLQDLTNVILDEQCPFKAVPRCGLASKRYRTADGSCNNLKFPRLGTALSPLQRFLPPVYDDGIQSERRSIFGSPLPSPRLISTNIHQQRNIETPTLSLMLMQWGQFLDHDITSTVSSRAFNTSIPRCCLPGGSGILPFEFMHPECMPISVPETDVFFNKFGVRCMEFVRSAPATRINCKLGWREQINQATSFIDASMIYGSDVNNAESLRTLKRGQLIFGNQNKNCHFGAISSSCFSSGDKRFSEQPALTALHTIWVKFHNKIAEELAEFNPHWSDEKIYQETRRIIAALIQHITYREFLPIVLGSEVIELFELKLLRDGFYGGYDESVNPTTSNEFSTAAFRFGHSLVPNSILRDRMVFENVSLHEEVTNFRDTLTPGSLHRIILGVINQPSQVRDEFISEELTRHLFQSPGGAFGVDLASVNVQRGRDHGLPPYTSWRAPCGLTPLKTFLDLGKVIPKETAVKFKLLFEDVDDIDLYTGGLSEKSVRGGLIGPVFACIVAQQFLNYRKGDRFWYENAGFESSFNLEQLNEIRKVSLAEILCGVLKSVDSIQNFVFLLADDDKNPRISCDEIVSNGLNLEYWRDFSEFDENRLTFKRNLGHKDKARSIGEYIIDTIEDYYDDSYDYEEHRRKPIKKKKSSTKKPKIATQTQELEVKLKDEEDKLTLIPLLIHNSSKNDNKNDLVNNAQKEFKEKPNYQVNVNINYVLGGNFEPSKPQLNNNNIQKRPLHTDRLYIKDEKRPFLDDPTFYLDKDETYLTDRLYFDKNCDQNKPCANYDPNRLSFLYQTTKKLNNNPIYLINTKTTTSKPNYFVTGYQLKKTTTTSIKDFYDVPIFISSNQNKFTSTTRNYVQDVGYDEINEDFTTKKTNFQNFPTDRPQFSNFKFTTKSPNYLFNPQFVNNNNNNRPIYAKDPIDDVYTTILKKPTQNLILINNVNKKQKIDNKLDFKSELLPNKLKTKDVNLVKIYSVKSSGFKLEGKDAKEDEKNLLLPDLDGTKIVRIEVVPSEIKFLRKKLNEKSIRGDQLDEMLMSNVSYGEISDELPNQMDFNNVKRRNG
ncbi:peroxidasin homolog [Onthophagus taurus]|uniref:peroxidasin homolog n=1 Tax=Onthophagus taurus TaxID=166361 RepID=UPI0039BDFECB